MRKILSGITVAALACILAACGGSDDKAFESPTGGGTGPGSTNAALAALSVTSSSPTIASGSSWIREVPKRTAIAAVVGGGAPGTAANRK